MRTNLLYSAILCVLGMMLGACTEKENVGGTATDSLPDEPTDTIPRPTEGEWIDLGLPSGLLWASCNLGANTPTEYGNYYAWAETRPKSVYDGTTYIYGYFGASGLLAYLKYTPSDSLTTLEPMDDAATENLGNGARTPTIEEWKEMFRNCTMKYVHYSNNGEDYNYIPYIHGHLFTGPNGNSIFLPCAGYRKGDGWGEYRNHGYGYYWSSSCRREVEGSSEKILPCYIWTHVDVNYGISHGYYDIISRLHGLSVRAVRPK